MSSWRRVCQASSEVIGDPSAAARTGGMGMAGNAASSIGAGVANVRCPGALVFASPVAQEVGFGVHRHSSSAPCRPVQADSREMMRTGKAKPQRSVRRSPSA